MPAGLGAAAPKTIILLEYPAASCGVVCPISARRGGLGGAFLAGQAAGMDGPPTEDDHSGTELAW